MSTHGSADISCPMSSAANSGARSSGPTGSRVAGCSGGSSGLERCGATLNQADGMSAWLNEKRGSVISAGAATHPLCQDRAAVSVLSATGAELGERLLEERLAVGVGAPLLHVRQVRLVRLGAPGRRRVLLVGVGRQAAAGAVPGTGELRVVGERRLRVVAVRAPERDDDPLGALTPLGLAHRTGTDPGSPDRVASGHVGATSASSGPARPSGPAVNPRS